MKIRAARNYVPQLYHRRVSFDRKPCLLCARLVTSYLSKWSTGTSCQSFVRIAKTVREYIYANQRMYACA